MKRNDILPSATLALAATALTACSGDDTEGLTRITHYATITLQGDAVMTTRKGAPFDDPGCKAVAGGQDISSRIVVTGDLDTQTSGKYTLTYTVANDDGFTATATRTVYVFDFADGREGIFHTTPDSYRDYKNAQTPFGAQYEIVSIARGDGQYEIDDLLGGWYSQHMGYGEKYCSKGVIAVAADGTVSLLSCEKNQGWPKRDYRVTALSGTYDAATGRYSLVSTFVGMDLHFTLTK